MVDCKKRGVYGISASCSSVLGSCHRTSVYAKFPLFKRNVIERQASERLVVEFYCCLPVSCAFVCQLQLVAYLAVTFYLDKLAYLSRLALLLLRWWLLLGWLLLRLFRRLWQYYHIAF